MKIIVDAAPNQRDTIATDLAYLVKTAPIDTLQFLAQIYREIPKSQRVEVIAQTVSLLQSNTVAISTHKCLSTLLKAVYTIPQSEREAVITQAKSLFRGKYDAQKTAFFLARIEDIPPDERAELIAQVLPWFRGKYDTTRRSTFLTRLAGIPRRERVDVMAHVRLFLQSSNNLSEIETWLQAVAAIPLAERADVLAHARPLLESSSDLSELQTWLQAIAAIPQHERADVMAHAMPYLGGTERQYEKTEFLRLIVRIPRAERGNLLSYTKRFLLPGLNLQRLVTILQALAAISSDQRADVIAHVTPWLSSSAPERTIVLMLEQIARVPQDKRKEFIDQRVVALEPFTIIEGWRTLLATLISVPQNRLSDVLTRTTSLARGLTEVVSIQHILQLVALLDTMQQLDIVDQTIPLIQEQMPLIQRVVLLLRALLGEEGENAYILNIARQELHDMPERLLHNLCEQFKQQLCTRLAVLFLGEQGIDGGGLGREFITELFTGIRDKMRFKELENGLFRPELLRGRNGTFQPLTDQDKTTLNELGQVMMFCLNASEDYLIGMLFDRGVFEALVRFEDRHLGEFESLKFDELFSIYSSMNYKVADRKLIESMKECLKPLTKATQDFVLKDAFAAVETDETIAAFGIEYDLEKIKEHYSAIQQALKKHLLEEVIHPAIAPIIEIAKGMRDAPFHTRVSWQDIHGMNARTLADQLQGVVTREMILDKLQFGEGMSQDKKKWIQNWIQRADDEKIKKFLFAMTGASSLGRKPLHIQKSSEKFIFHTCYNQMEIPIDALNSEAVLATILEATISGKEYTLD